MIGQLRVLNAFGVEADKRGVAFWARDLLWFEKFDVSIVGVMASFLDITPVPHSAVVLVKNAHHSRASPRSEPERMGRCAASRQPKR